MRVFELRIVKRKFWFHEGIVDSQIDDFILDFRFMTLKQALHKRDLLFQAGYTPDQLDIVCFECNSFRDQNSCDYAGTINTMTGKDAGY